MGATCTNYGICSINEKEEEDLSFCYIKKKFV